MSDKVRVTFVFTPEEPDPDDPTGMSNAEYEGLMDALAELGAEDTQVVKA